MLLLYVRSLASVLAHHLQGISSHPALRQPRHASLAHLLEQAFWEAAILHSVSACHIGKSNALNLLSTCASKEGHELRYNTLFRNLPPQAAVGVVHSLQILVNGMTCFTRGWYILSPCVGMGIGSFSAFKHSCPCHSTSKSFTASFIVVSRPLSSPAGFPRVWTEEPVGRRASL